MVTQISSLIIRNLQTIRHQKAMVICHIITPIVCLLFIYIIKNIVESEIMKTRFSLKLDVPIIFNVPLYSKFKYSNLTAKTDTCEEWYLYDFEKEANDSETRELFGKLLDTNNILQFYCDDNNKSTNSSPFFIDICKITNCSDGGSIDMYLYNKTLELNYIELEKLYDPKSLSNVSDGAITVSKLNNSIFSYKLQIHDLRVPFYHRANAVTMFYIKNEKENKYETYPTVMTGMLWGIGLFNKAYMHHLFPNVTVASGIQLMPISLDDNEDNIQRIINVVGVVFYPMAISLLLPLFMYNIVIEKERQLIEIMKINGFKMINYWIGYLIYYYIVYVVTALFYVFSGVYVFGLNLFKETSPLLVFLTLFEWGFAQIGIAFFFQSLINNSRTTSILGYLFTIINILIFSCLNAAMWVIPIEAPYILNLFPQFALCRIFFYMTCYCGYASCISDFSEVETEVKYALVYMIIGAFLFMILGGYLHEVLPKQYGIRKNPIFCITESVESCKKSNKNYQKKFEKKEDKISQLISNDESNLSNNDNVLNDEEIDKEFSTVNNLVSLGKDELRNYPLVCDGLTKIYPSNLKSKDPVKRKKKSLNNFTICLKNNEIFGLLGPNGAGKTTFFSILTGIYEPTYGNAYIRGNSILNEIEETHKYIGYCPQFDLLWEDLSVENTLLFYSRLKNKEKNKVNEMLEKILISVRLQKFRNYLVRELSGGMKRRLSLGIALIGEPPIVFLDEPTTGLDPKNKREIWEILSKCKENRCMILTTHLMDEAECLCDRIGIILKGSLRCLGTHYKLKTEYGKGFKLCVNLKPYENDEEKKKSFGFVFDNNFILEQNVKNEMRIKKVIEFISGIFPVNCKVNEKHRNAVIFEIGSDVFNPELLFKNIEEKKEELQITNWAISQVDLEDIFIKLTENDL